MYKISIRPFERKDIKIIQQLTEELGYSSTVEQITERFQKLEESESNAILVSVDEKSNVTGWIHVFGSLRLESDPFAEIGGLVVSPEFRNRGIGKTLVNAAEKWAWGNGYKSIRVRSRTARTDARRFYERENYIITKEQNVFEKKL